VPLVYGALYLATFYPLGRALGGERLGLVTLALAALCPPLLATWSSAPRGGYPEMLFLGQLAMLLAIGRSPEDARVPPSGRALALLGLAGGLAFWTHPESAVFLVAAAAALFLRDRRIVLRADAWLAAGAFVAGSAPMWVHQARHAFDTFSLVSAGPSGASVALAARTLLAAHLPKLVGVRELVGRQEIVLGAVGCAAGVVVAAALAAGAWSALRRAREHPGWAALLVLLVTLLAVYLPSRYGTWNTQRYLLPLYGVVFPFAASALLALADRSRLLATLAAALVGVVFARGAWHVHVEFRAPERAPAYLPAVVEFMERHGVRHGFADHDEALVNTYRSEERVVLLDRGIRRYPVAEIPDWRPDSILARGDGEDLRAGLEAVGCRFRSQRFGAHTLFYEIRPARPDAGAIDEARWRPAASAHEEEAALAIDGDPRTRWASHEPQRPGLSFTVDLGEERDFAAVRVHSGPFVHDVPRALRVEGQPEGGAWTALAELSRPYPGLTVANGVIDLSAHATVEARFAPARVRRIRLVETASDARFDWSITEIELLAAPPPA
jgi:F5/8 type C domain-containing protein